MSHTLRVSAAQAEKDGFLVIKDTATIKAVDILEKTCKKLGLAKPLYEEKVKLFSSNWAKGYAVRLPNWRQPTVFNTETGEIAYDNYNGDWGNIAELDKFRQEYERQFQQHHVDMATEEAVRNGYHTEQTTMEDGRIKLEVYS